MNAKESAIFIPIILVRMLKWVYFESTKNIHA